MLTAPRATLRHRVDELAFAALVALVAAATPLLDAGRALLEALFAPHR
jgi:hypothetical protein